MSEPGALLGRVLRPTAAKVLPLAYRTRVRGCEHIPAGPAILSGNHVSYLDPVLLWCVAPRLVSFMAKAELFEMHVLRWALPGVGAFPVRRGAADREAISRAGRLLEEGGLVGIFPEGTRSREGLGEAHQGAAWVSLRTGAPIVPVGIAGTERIMPEGAHLPRFPRVALSFGEPLRPEEYRGGDRKQQIAAMTVELMARIAQELERAEGARHAR